MRRAIPEDIAILRLYKIDAEAGHYVDLDEINDQEGITRSMIEYTICYGVPPLDGGRLWSRYYVFEEDGEFVGYAEVSDVTERMKARLGDCIEIRQFSITPSRRGQGIGTRALQTLLGEFPDHNAMVRCSPSSETFVGLVTNAGFEARQRGLEGELVLVLRRQPRWWQPALFYSAGPQRCVNG